MRAKQEKGFPLLRMLDQQALGSRTSSKGPFLLVRRFIAGKRIPQISTSDIPTTTTLHCNISINNPTIVYYIVPVLIFVKRAIAENAGFKNYIEEIH